MLPQIKTYKIDYQFIIDNYTDPKLWSQTWNLFVFKNYVFTLSLSSIDVKKYEITFEIVLDSDLNIYNHSKTLYVRHNLKNSNIDILKKQINGVMFQLVEYLENEVIRTKQEYKEIENSQYSEQEYLREIAGDFLDDNGVTNSEIRDVYIDYYVNENETIYKKLSDITEKMQYNHLTDLFLILVECSDDIQRKEKVLKNLHNQNEVQELLQEVKEYVEYIETEEWADDMRNKLEAV